MQLVEVEAERARALQAHRLVEHVGGDEGLPSRSPPIHEPMRRNEGTRAPRRAGPERVERVLDRAVEPRQLAEEGVVVIGEAVGDLVDHLQPGLAQHVGAPEDQHGAPQLLLDRARARPRRRGAVALVEERRDLELADQGALAAHLRRVRGEHRAHQRAVEEVARAPSALDARLARAVEGEGERAGARRRAGLHVRAVAADVVLVLGDVGEMREVAEGAHDGERLVGGEAVERRLELAQGAGLVVAVEADRGLPDLLDERVGLLALLLAHRVAEDAAEQADVVAQRPVLFGVVVEDRFHGHESSIARQTGSACRRAGLKASKMRASQPRWKGSIIGDDLPGRAPPPLRDKGGRPCICCLARGACV